MARNSLGRVADLDAAGRLIGSTNGRSVAAFRTSNGEIVAYENICPHQGGPVCAGRLFPKVEARVEGDAVVEHFSHGKTMLNCPWHGWEFYLDTGVCRANSRYRLRSVPVAVEGDEVVIDA